MNVLITGGDGGIGKSIVNIYKNNNYNVVSPSIDEMDLTSKESIDSYFDNNNKFDIFIHCAGINNPDKFLTLSYENIEETLKINTMSAIHISKLLLGNMNKNNFGRIVNISSLWSKFAREGRIAYSMSKSSLDALTRGLAIEYGKDNILVNSVLPGFIDTKLTRTNLSDDVISGIENNTPVKRLGTPEDIAKVVYFLGSKENSFITGQSIIADGGYSL